MFHHCVLKVHVHDTIITHLTTIYPKSKKRRIVHLYDSFKISTYVNQYIIIT